MKKILLSILAFAFVSGARAQNGAVEFQLGMTLTESSIHDILATSKRNGIKPAELETQKEMLYKIMKKQQDGTFAAEMSQRGAEPPMQVNSSGCVNPGFETGNTTGWSFIAGYNSGNNLPCASCFGPSYTVINQVVNATSNATVNNPPSSCSSGNTAPCTNGIDNYGGFPVVAPGGGTYSLLLNNTCTNYKMQQAQYTFVVGSSNDLFIFNYAAVLQNGGHPPNRSPYFNVTTTDLTTGLQPACAQYNAIATSGNIAGWSTSTTAAASGAGGGVIYKPWTTVSLDLQAAIGHTVTIKFSVSDCNQGGHFGYCYIDAACSNPSAAAGVVGVCGTVGGNVTLSAPPGYSTYQWYGPSPNTSTPIAGATTQTLSTVATVNDTFVVHTTSAAGCPASFNIVIQPSAISAITSATATCKGGLNGAVALNTGGSGTFQYSWTGPSGPLGTSTTTALNNLPAGTYSVAIVDNVAHCPTKDTTITVAAINPTLQTSTVSVCGSQANLSAPAGSSYTWYDTVNVVTAITAQTYTAHNTINNQHYTVTYLDPASHCLDSLQMQLAVTNITFNPSPLPSCPTGSTGSITYYAGTANTYTLFNWACSNGSSNTNTTAPIQVSNLPGGVYTTTISVPGNATCMEIITSTVGLTTSGAIPVTTNTLAVCNLDQVTIDPAQPTGAHNWSGPGITPPTTTTTLSITTPFTNTTTAFYTYSDTITITGTGGCISKSVYKEIISLKSFKVTLSMLEKPLCYHDTSGKIKATATASGPISSPDVYSFSWSPITYTSSATGAPAFSVYSKAYAGVYSCIVRNGNCIDTAKALTVPDGLLNPKTDSILAYYCAKDSLATLVIPNPSAKVNIQWYPSRFVQNDTIRVSTTKDSASILTPLIPYCYATYKKGGCPDTARTIIQITTYNAFMPKELVNVFSPNGDKVNDFFFPFYQNNMNQYQIYRQAQNYELKVYNRWGLLVYSTTDYNQPWNGKINGTGVEADAGTYFFVVKYQSNCSSLADVVEQKGFLELVR
ncbi:MAG: gliding motility-associated C-terminal domain-containing protein [Bacteroidetes bacterium]|nr:gliding motility-associated C-terminal domain-containing protein [Bacteroidota bacterium]